MSRRRHKSAWRRYASSDWNGVVSHWVAEIAGKKEEWDARITEQQPDQRVAWTSEGGAMNAGVVTFHRLEDAKTRVMLQMDYEPEGFVESAGDALGFVSRRVEGDLGRFKTFIEEAWTGDGRMARQDRLIAGLIFYGGPQRIVARRRG